MLLCAERRCVLDAVVCWMLLLRPPPLRLRGSHGLVALNFCTSNLNRLIGSIFNYSGESFAVVS